MADMREALREGDRTTTGGVLISTVHNFTADRKVAGEGDWASCPACKKGGRTMNDAYPNFTLEDGRQILVEGARVMCGCAEKPLVIPSYRNFSIEVNRSGLLSMQVRSDYSPYSSSTRTGRADDLECYFEIINAKTGAPIEGMTYKVSSVGEAIVNDADLVGGKTKSFSMKDYEYLTFLAWRGGAVR